MRAYAVDLRQRVVTAGEVGEGTLAEVAGRLRVGQTFGKKMLREWRERGDLSAPPHRGGAKASLGARQLQSVLREGKREPDAPLEEWRHFLSETESVAVSEATVCRALQRLNMPRKKRV